MNYEVFSYEEPGYKRGITFENWTVALMNCEDRFVNITKLERHNLTDEVFVLLCGEATLLIGEEAEEVAMEKNKLYNVKAGVYHATRMSEDAKLLIVENANTSRENTEYIPYEK